MRLDGSKFSQFTLLQTCCVGTWKVGSASDIWLSQWPQVENLVNRHCCVLSFATVICLRQASMAANCQQWGVQLLSPVSVLCIGLLWKVYICIVVDKIRNHLKKNYSLLISLSKLFYIGFYQVPRILHVGVKATKSGPSWHPCFIFPPRELIKWWSKHHI